MPAQEPNVILLCRRSCRCRPPFLKDPGALHEATEAIPLQTRANVYGRLPLSSDTGVPPPPPLRSKHTPSASVPTTTTVVPFPAAEPPGVGFRRTPAERQARHCSVRRVAPAEGGVSVSWCPGTLWPPLTARRVPPGGQAARTTPGLRPAQPYVVRRVGPTYRPEKATTTPRAWRRSVYVLCCVVSGARCPGRRTRSRWAGSTSPHLPEEPSHLYCTPHAWRKHGAPLGTRLPSPTDDVVSAQHTKVGLLRPVPSRAGGPDHAQAALGVALGVSIWTAFIGIHI